MGIITDTNEIIPSNFSGPSGNGDRTGCYKMCAGQIVSTWYIDNKRNVSKRFVEYEVAIFENYMTVSHLLHCIALDSSGDQNNFNEHIYQATTYGKRGDKSDTEGEMYKNGAYVLVGFINGYKDNGVILQGIQHPSINAKIDDYSKVSSIQSKSDSIDVRLEELPITISGSKENGDNGGQRILGEYNGLRWNVNKYGELTIIFQGVKDEHGKIKDTDVQPTVMKINKDGEFFIIDNLDQEIKISRKNENITIRDSATGDNEIIIDRKNNKITVKSVNTVEVQADKVNVDSNTATIAGKTVKIGGQGAKQSAVLGDALMMLFNTHTHTSAASGLPTSPPTTPMNKNAHLSDNVKVDQRYSGAPKS